MPTPFPGMDPYLEHPYMWRDVHHSIDCDPGSSDLAASPLRPRYRVKVEVRTYLAEPDKLTFIGVPDVGAIRINQPPVTYAAASAAPWFVEVPVPDRN